MKNFIPKLLPLVEKLKGKKKSVIILSVVAIAAVIFAVQKDSNAINFRVKSKQVNNVPGNIKETRSVDSFKCQYKAHRMKVLAAAQ